MEKGRNLIAREKYYIYEINRASLHLNHIHIDTFKPIIQALYKRDTR
jgi:hypothetical protein